jgi:predicted TPR repeat methyltransferase
MVTGNRDSGVDEPLGLGEAYAVNTPDDNRRLYAKWAPTYESVFVDREKYRYPKAVAEVFAETVPSQNIVTVVDIGTGTGLTGMYLTALRNNLTVDGIDISPEMLGEARKKERHDMTPVYRDLYEHDLTELIRKVHGPYDALISSGTFTHGHLGPEVIANLLPLVRPGGWFVIGVNNEHFVAKEFDTYCCQIDFEARYPKN